MVYQLFGVTGRPDAEDSISRPVVTSFERPLLVAHASTVTPEPTPALPRNAIPAGLISIAIPCQASMHLTTSACVAGLRVGLTVGTLGIAVTKTGGMGGCVGTI